MKRELLLKRAISELGGSFWHPAVHPRCRESNFARASAFLPNVLTNYFDFACVLPNHCKLVSNLLRQPDLRRTPKRLGKTYC